MLLSMFSLKYESLEKLSFHEAMRCAKVSRLWRDLLAREECWRAMFKVYFGVIPLNATKSLFRAAYEKRDKVLFSCIDYIIPPMKTQNLQGLFRSGKRKKKEKREKKR